MADTTSAAPSDAEIDALIGQHWPSFATVGPFLLQRLRAAFRDGLAKWGAQPVVRKPLTDEQIQNLLGFGDPTEQEKHLIRLGRDAAHGITTTGRKDAP